MTGSIARNDIAQEMTESVARDDIKARDDISLNIASSIEELSSKYTILLVLYFLLKPSINLFLCSRNTIPIK